jgi:hypothetical protein
MTRWPSCLRCASEITVPVVYGYPSTETVIAARAGMVVIGGCSRLPETRACVSCGFRWESLRWERRRYPFDSFFDGEYEHLFFGLNAAGKARAAVALGHNGRWWVILDRLDPRPYPEFPFRSAAETAAEGILSRLRPPPGRPSSALA